MQALTGVAPAGGLEARLRGDGSSLSPSPMTRHLAANNHDDDDDDIEDEDVAATEVDSTPFGSQQHQQPQLQHQQRLKPN